MRLTGWYKKATEIFESAQISPEVIEWFDLENLSYFVQMQKRTDAATRHNVI